jgi:transketolase
VRDALARTLYELAREDERVVVLVADISPAGAMVDLRREFPDRFINVGVAEQSMIGLAAGLAMRGFRPFCYTIAPFALFRPYEFIRDDLAYQDLPVTVVGMGAGLAYPTLGGTHQAIEDVAVAMACPNLVVLAPCDPAEAAACARWCARQEGGPVYMRIGKAGERDLTSHAFEEWEFGALRVLRRGGEGGSCVLGYGPILSLALDAAERDGALTVVAAPTLEPADAHGLEWLLTLFRRVVVIEEASGAPLARQVQALAGRAPDARTEVVSLALPREFPHAYGTVDDLRARAGLTVDAIMAALRSPA